MIEFLIKGFYTIKGMVYTCKVWDGGLVYMGNDNACKIVGIGSVTLKYKDKTTKLHWWAKSHKKRICFNILKLDPQTGHE